MHAESWMLTYLPGELSPVQLVSFLSLPLLVLACTPTSARAFHAHTSYTGCRGSFNFSFVKMHALLTILLLQTGFKRPFPSIKSGEEATLQDICLWFRPSGGACSFFPPLQPSSTLSPYRSYPSFPHRPPLTNSSTSPPP